MRTKFFPTAAAFLAVATLATAQKVKTPKEGEALQAIQTAIQSQNPDACIKAVDDLITKFADTEFKSWALTRAAECAQRKGDSANAIIYGDRAIEADSKDFMAMLLVSGQLAQHTREFDLDKEEKLSKAEKYANDAMAALPGAAKFNPQIPDDAWANAKKDWMSQAHEDLGMIAVDRKKFDVSAAEFKLAIDTAANPDPADSVRLADSYIQGGKPDEALPLLDKVLAVPNLNPTVKQFALGAKARAEKAKASK